MRSTPKTHRAIDWLIREFEVRVDLPNPGGQLFPGQRCTLRFTLNKKQTLAEQWYNKIRQVIQTRSESKWT